MTPAVRRLCDVAVAGVALLVLLPFLLAIAVAVRLTSPGPVLFRQLRVGEGGRPFLLLKFRTMRPSSPGPRVTATSDPRVTPLGAWLRRWKLDELPQLLHVLRGEMTLIGPRPEVPEYLARLGPGADAYAAARPGLADAATLVFYDEGERLARARDPESHYLADILPEKARLSVAYQRVRTWRTDLQLLVRLGRRVVGLGVLLALLSDARLARAAGGVMIVAPHPDDEVLAAAGVLVTALGAGREVRVVVVTNGDFFGSEQGLIREGESVDALAALGLPENRVVFLGYPDAGLLLLWNNAPTTSQMFLSPGSGRQSTYATRGFGGADFHTVVNGVPGGYNRPTLVDDLRVVFATFRPQDVFVPGPYDGHPDHRAAYYAVREAASALAAADGSFRPTLHTTIVHDPLGYPFDDFWRAGMVETETIDLDGDAVWPSPAVALGVPHRFQPRVAFDAPPSLPAILDWSARVQWPVPAALAATAFDRNLKVVSLARYITQANDVLFAHVKTDEFFWPEPVRVSQYRIDVARAAHATASSAADGQPASAVIDGVVDGAPVRPDAEWVASEPGWPAWVRLDWRVPVLVDRVVLYDRVDPAAHVTAGRLSFDDGAAVVPFGPLANDGRGDTFILPAPRRMRTLTVLVDAGTGAPGLAEVEAFGVPDGGPCTDSEACDDGNPCTVDTCTAGRCAYRVLADGVGCADADACNGVELCRAGVCERGAPPDCDDGDPCTRDGCAAPGTCVHEQVCHPVPARGLGGCRLSFVGLPLHDCRDGDPGCDQDGRVDGACRFLAVLCLDATTRSHCPVRGEVSGVVAVDQLGFGVGALAGTLRPKPAGTSVCVGPAAITVRLRGRDGRRAVHQEVPIRVLMSDGRSQRARVRVSCRAAARGAIAAPAPLGP